MIENTTLSGRKLLLLGCFCAALAACIQARTSPNAAAVGADQSLGDFTDRIATEVQTMEVSLDNLTTVIDAAEVHALRPVEGTGTADANRQRLLAHTRLVQLVAARQHGQVKAMEIQHHEVAMEEAQAERDDFGLNTLSIEEDDDVNYGVALPDCVVADVGNTLGNCAEVLDRVAYKIFTEDTLNDLQVNNEHLHGFVYKCTFRFVNPDEKTSLLARVQQVQEHVQPAEAATVPDQEPGVPIDSAYMVIFITFSVVLGVLLLTGMAVVSYKYAKTPGSRRQSAGRATGPAQPRTAATAPQHKVAGYRNAAYSSNPALTSAQDEGPLHETENWRWRRQSDIELRDGVDDEPITTRQAKQSTMGRIWGGVVRDYERHSPATRQPPPATHMLPRPHVRPGQGYHSDGDVAAERRAMDKPLQEDRRGQSRRGDADDNSWEDRGQQRRPSPTPLGRPTKSSVGDGGQWSYGASGRQKSTDSPFQSAW